MQDMTSGAFAAPQSPSRLPGGINLPGFLFATTIAAVALELRGLIGITTVSPLIIAIVLGLAFQNTVGTPAAFKPGIVFGMRRGLRFAIVLLGVQLSWSQVVEVGSIGLGVIVASLEHNRIGRNR